MANNYDEAMEQLPGTDVAALIVDIQGVPPGGSGSTFSVFNAWMFNNLRHQHPAVVYLIHKGTRRPHFRLEGPILKKPFPMEAVGEAVRSLIGPAEKDGDAPGLELDLATNTLRSVLGAEHLTNIEATLLAYLMAHRGEIMAPHALLVDVWQYSDPAGASTLVRAHISNIRKKLRTVVGNDKNIQTIRSKGYRYIA
jgi:DNA-binding response OmpR family regulator